MQRATSILATVMHSGTGYFKHGLIDAGENVYEFHTLSPRSVDWCQEALEQGKKLWVTYRDPKRVAASWANRERDFQWWDQVWENYWKIRELDPMVLELGEQVQYGIDFGVNPINSFPDKHGLHAALDRGDMDIFYNHVPRGLQWLQ